MGRNSLTKDELIQELCRLKRGLDRVPSTEEMNELGKYSVPTYIECLDRGTTRSKRQDMSLFKQVSADLKKS
jgi:hypothetical protein